MRLRRLLRPKQTIDQADADTWEVDIASGVIRRQRDGEKPLVVIVDPALRKTGRSTVSHLPPRDENFRFVVVGNPGEAPPEKPSMVCLQLPPGKLNRVRVKRQIRAIQTTLGVRGAVLLAEILDKDAWTNGSWEKDAVFELAVEEGGLPVIRTLPGATPADLSGALRLHIISEALGAQKTAAGEAFDIRDWAAKTAELSYQFDTNKEARTSVAVPGEVVTLPPTSRSKPKKRTPTLGENSNRQHESVVAVAESKVYNSAAMAITDFSTAKRELSTRDLQWPTEKWDTSAEKASRKTHALVTFLQRVWQPFTQSNGLLITRRELAEHDTDAAEAVKAYVRANELPAEIGIIRTRDIKTLQAKNPKLTRVSHLRIA